MKSASLKSLLIGTACSFLLVCGNTNIAQAQRADACKLKGAVFIEPNRAFAHYKVFVESTESFADLTVFKADNALFADQVGKWYFVNNRSFADFTIFIEKTKSFADFSIYYTETESFAGCR